MGKYRCTVCNYIYDEDVESDKFDELPDDWRCPVCNSPKSVFVPLQEESVEHLKGDKSVSDILVGQMAELGLKHVFGIPGTSILGVVDAIKNNPKLEFIQVRHEQTAAFMASAYGKLTGNVAACLTVAGPGATNLATGLYDAKLDHSPVVALTGMVKRQLIGPGSFQEIDQYSFFEPLTVFNKILMSRDQTTTLATLAIKHSLIERGVSHIGIPNDVQKLDHQTKLVPFKGNFPTRATKPTEYLIERAAKIIDKSERPVIIAGFGSIEQGEALLKFAEKIKAPITTTFRAKGVVDEYEDLYVGSHGGIGSTASTKLVDDADLLIVIGSSFSDMTQIPEKKTVQIDIDPLMISRRFPVEVGLIGNCSEILPMLHDLVKEVERKDYMEEMAKLKKEWIELLKQEFESDKTPLRAPYILGVLNEMIDKDAIITLDVGEHCWWFGRNFWMKKTQKMIMSGNLASMGFGFPAALTSQLMYPDKQVVCITGDGGFSMVMADFLTAVKYELPIKVFIFNNKQLGMIMQEQKMEGYENWQTELQDLNYADYARCCGGVGIKVEKPEDLPAAVEKALKSEKPVIVDINTDPKRFV
ncbi:Acetolactate synthase [Methanobacterium lacus]|uniref:Acetolactate synthase n=1 Tax=Methanobacterium lacus (strain AL-21) TaxID=877455 RepID=F0TBI6_METLA|nr:thiamine pyrophosphate-dependent enzyme [Methanobacterium lacus]ADZ10255.1 Acetolactate synthase [Methanobacterium lacus]